MIVLIAAAVCCIACAAGGGRVDCPLDADLTTMAGEFELYCESTWMLSLGPSVDMAGIAAGSLLGGALSDRFGRRRAFLGFFALQCLSYACSSAAPSMGVYFALKLLVGVFGGAANVATTPLAARRSAAAPSSALETAPMASATMASDAPRVSAAAAAVSYTHLRAHET